MYSRILVPVDLDNADKLSKALDLAGEIAKENDAEVIYVDVVDAVPTTSARTVGDRREVRLRDFAADQAEKYSVKTTGQVVLRSDLHLNVGSDVIEAAKEDNCDLIVMASHEPGFKDHILSSNAGYVAAHAPMTVYVVR